MQKKNAHNSPNAANEPARISTAAQFDALSSPVRDQIAQVVVNQTGREAGSDSDPQAVRGASISEIAEQLGRPPGSLYRHIEVLVKTGILREVGTRQSGGRDAMVYEAPGTYLRLQTPKTAGPEMDALCRYLERMGAHAGRECAAAARGRLDQEIASGQHDDGTMSMFGWLDQQQRDRLREIMHELVEIFERAERRPGTRLIATSLMTRPVRLPNGSTGVEPE